MKILDCTLRDGAHVTSGWFGKERILSIIHGLNNAGIDIIEFGFLQGEEYDADKVFFPALSDVDNLMVDLPGDFNKKSTLSIMARPDRVSLNSLDYQSDYVDMIRFAFYYDDAHLLPDYVEMARKNNYKVSLNPIVASHLTAEMCEKINEIALLVNPDALSIVDTFGALDEEKTRNLIDWLSPLPSNCYLGLHLHENLLLAQSIIFDVIKKRGSDLLVVDSSLFGLGRAPGNVATELLVNQYKELRDRIDVSKLVKIIGQEIEPLKSEFEWGYSPEYFSSARHNVHRDYAEALRKAGHSFDEIDNLCMTIAEKNPSQKLNKNLLNKLL